MLQKLTIKNVRNISEASCHFHHKLTVFQGPNGAGKSTVLEAIHLACMGRSFRSRHNKHIIQHDQNELFVVAQLLTNNQLQQKIGITKTLHNKNSAHLNGEPVVNSATLAQAMPLQLLEPQSFELLSGSPDTRRQYLDWGVFHVEHSFYPCWKNVQRIIKQRNAMLKQQTSAKEFDAWDQDLIQMGEQLHLLRSNYVEALTPILDKLLEVLAPSLANNLTFKYQRGWSAQLSLGEALAKHFQHDSATGYTHVGPHRASMQLHYQNQPAQMILSKGQQKCLVWALRLAQSQLFDQTHRSPCLFLIDDLAAELDPHNQARFADLLLSMDNQIIATCIDPAHLKPFTDRQPDHAMFHVEHGIVNPVSSAVSVSHE